jgi:hypothetical protein
LLWVLTRGFYEFFFGFSQNYPSQLNGLAIAGFDFNRKPRPEDRGNSRGFYDQNDSVLQKKPVSN